MPRRSHSEATTRQLWAPRPPWGRGLGEGKEGLISLFCLSNTPWAQGPANLNLSYEVIILVYLCGGVLYEGLFLTKQCKNNISEVLDQLTLLKMQKWLGAQCFGPIDLAENAKMAWRVMFWTN